MAAADYRLMTEATGQRIAAALEALSGTGAAAAAARANLDVYSKGETNNAIAQSTAFTTELDIANAETGYTIVSSWQRNFGVLHQIFVKINKNGNTFSANEEGKTLAKIDGTFYGTTQCIMAASNTVNYLANRYVSVSFYNDIIRLDSLFGNADIKEIVIIWMYIR